MKRLEENVLTKQHEYHLFTKGTLPENYETWKPYMSLYARAVAHNTIREMASMIEAQTASSHLYECIVSKLRPVLIKGAQAIASEDRLPVNPDIRTAWKHLHTAIFGGNWEQANGNRIDRVYPKFRN